MTAERFTGHVVSTDLCLRTVNGDVWSRWYIFFKVSESFVFVFQSVVISSFPYSPLPRLSYRDDLGNSR